MLATQEILFAPLTGLEVTSTSVEGSVLLVHVRLSVNLQALTIEQVHLRYVASSQPPYGRIERYVRYANTPSNTFAPNDATWTVIAEHLTDFSLAYENAGGTALTGTLTASRTARPTSFGTHSSNTMSAPASCSALASDTICRARSLSRP